MRWTWPLALAGALLTGLLLAFAAVLAALVTTGTTLAWTGVAAVALLSSALGVLVARRVPGSRLGLLLVAGAATLAYSAARENAEALLARHPEDWRSLGWLVAVTAESSVWVFTAFALLLLYFPDGRLPGRRWRVLPPLLLLTSLVHHAYGAVDDEPYQAPLQHVPKAFGPPPLALELLSFAADVVLLACLIACAVSLPLRYRRADDVRRRQLRWLALAGLAVPGFIVTCLVEIGLTGASGAASVAVGLVAIVGIPLSITVALLRHDLFDVDRVIATTVAYALATALLVGGFGGAALASGLLVGGRSTVAVAAATALGAAALAPLRRRLQRGVDRRLYPMRRAALEAIDGLQRGIGAGTARPEALAGQLRAALRDPALRVGYLLPGSRRLVDETGAPVDAAGAVPVIAAGATIGVLRASSPALSDELLRQVAEASATLVELVRLRLELAEALREVEQSRARLVVASDRERRRLERDLHDGAQQRLVSLGMALRVAQRRLGGGGVDVDGLLDQAVAELATAVAELRTIAHGLRPSSLDDGLHAALVALTQHVPIPIELHVHSEVLPDDVTTTVYYVASEAIANAVKHAGASRIAVRVVRENGHVEVRVSDDGRGGACLGAGTGLAGLQDRVSAVGGRLVLDSAARRGTVVEAVVPCAS